MITEADRRSYLEDLIERMTVKENVKSSDGSISFKAHREAEKINDSGYLPVLKSLIDSHKAKKYKKYRDAAYFIMAKLLKNDMLIEYLEFYIDRLGQEEDKQLIEFMLLNIKMNFNMLKNVDIQPILICAQSDKWQIRHAAIQALGSFDTEESRKMLEYYIRQTDEKEYYYEIIYAQSSLCGIGTVEDIPLLELHIKSRRRDIRESAKFVINKIMENNSK